MAEIYIAELSAGLSGLIVIIGLFYDLTKAN